MPDDLVILDGGMGRELERIGAPFRQPEWSAAALIDAPDFVGRAHDAFIAAGATMITTNSYALVPFHIGSERFARDGQRLADLAGRLARTSADRARHKVLVAGSLPPLFGSYRPDLFVPDEAPALLDVLIGGLAPHVDLWLAETLSSLVEARAVRKALAADTRPLWLSFTLDDEDPVEPPRLRSGELVTEATRAAIDLGAAAILFNCSQPEVMRPALAVARAALGHRQASLRLGVYANAFPPQRKTATANATVQGLRGDLTPAQYLEFARFWADDGATILGGCCGIGPDHISCLAHDLRRSDPTSSAHPTSLTGR
jgi:S-methylmethionine-dependent homocysteine/selenocysteine methylase